MKLGLLAVRIVAGLITIGCGCILLWLIAGSNLSILINIPALGVAIFLLLGGAAIIVRPKALKGIVEVIGLWF